MIHNCKICGIRFDSEGHELSEWLTLCHKCNAKYPDFEARNKEVEKSLLEAIEENDTETINIMEEKANNGEIIRII